MKNDISNYYNELADKYDDDRFGNTYGRYIDMQEKRIMSKLLKNNLKDRTLDLACGTGRFLDFACNGADASSQMLAIARQKYPDCNLQECNALETSFGNESFKTILSFHFVMHLNKEDTSAFLDETYRLLEPNGMLIFDFPSKYRRKLVNYKASSWHASNHLGIDDLEQIPNKWIVEKYYGILFFPIHRFPVKIRFLFKGLDTLLCRSFLKKYASYLIVVMRKKD